MNNIDLMQQCVTALITQGKGILAIDESFQTIKKRFDSINIESIEDNRRAYRDLLITHPQAADYISGMILFDETIRQSTQAAKPFPKVLEESGIMIGIKVDTGAKDMAGHKDEKITEGLDGLRDRLNEYLSLGARFAKWRAVITIDENLPSVACIEANAHALARYASLCQEVGIVPIIEPEVLMDGEHSIEHCYNVTEATLKAVFDALYLLDVAYEYTVLKINMVVAAKKCSQQADPSTIADMTVSCLLNSVPAAVAGIVFLSGGQSAQDATVHLNEMNKKYPNLPWSLSFSYGRALQEPCLKTWQGKAANVAAAQEILLHREHCNSLASMGEYQIDMEHHA